MIASDNIDIRGPFGESEAEWMQRLEDNWLAEGLDAATDADRALDEEREVMD